MIHKRLVASALLLFLTACGSEGPSSGVAGDAVPEEPEAPARAELIERDIDGDGVDESLIVSEGADGTLRAEADRDRDGRADLWAVLRGERLESVEYDNDGDGRPEVWELFDRQNRLSERHYDMNRDGEPDLWSIFGAGGLVVESRQDSSGDGEPDIWSEFDAEGRLSKAAYDRTGDGEIDLTVEYAADGTVRRVSR